MDTLPQEVLLYILSFLPTTEDLLRAEAVESRWFHLLRDDDAGTWRRVYERDFGGPVQNKAKKQQKVPESWRSRCARGARGVRSKLRQSHLTLEARNTKLLRWACMFGHHRIIAQLFASGAVPRDQLAPDTLTQDTKRTAIFPLHLAAASGGALAVEEVLKAGFAVEQRNASGATPIGIAAQTGSMDVVEVLLRHGAETGEAIGHLGAKGKNALPLLHQAASQGHKEIVRAVLEHISECDQDKFKTLINSAESRQGNTPLHLAAGGGHDETVVFLLEQGADLTASNLMGHQPLHLATSHGRLSTVRLLLSKGAAENIDPRTSPFLLACELQLAEIVDVFLEHGFDINSNEEGQNPLLVALRSRHTQASFIEFLIARGADLGVRFTSTKDILCGLIEWSPEKIDTIAMLIDRFGPVDNRTDLLEGAVASAPRRWLPASSFIDLIEMLLGKGIALPRHNTDLLAKAVASHKIELIQYLLDKGIHVDAHKENGSTALYQSVYYAIGSNEEGRDIFQFLLKKGADPNIICGWRKDTAVHWACSLGCSPSIIQLFVDHGADINKRMIDGRTPLFRVLADVFSHSDANRVYHELAQALVRMGAGPKLCVDSEGLDPYQWVLRYGDAVPSEIPPSAIQLAEELRVAIDTSQLPPHDEEDKEREEEETRE